MKKFLTLLMALLVSASLTFAQTGAGSTGDQAASGKRQHKTEEKGHKGGKKGHKGGKKSKKGSSSTTSTTPPPK